MAHRLIATIVYMDYKPPAERRGRRTTKSAVDGSPVCWTDSLSGVDLIKFFEWTGIILFAVMLSPIGVIVIYAITGTWWGLVLMGLGFCMIGMAGSGE